MCVIRFFNHIFWQWFALMLPSESFYGTEACFNSVDFVCLLISCIEQILFYFCTCWKSNPAYAQNVRFNCAFVWYVIILHLGVDAWRLYQRRRFLWTVNQTLACTPLTTLPMSLLHRSFSIHKKIFLFLDSSVPFIWYHVVNIHLWSRWRVTVGKKKNR